MRAVALFLLIMLAGCGPDEQAPQAVSVPARPAVQGDVVEVRTEQVPLRIEVTGQVTAVAQATLSSKVQGTVQELRVREGDGVAKGRTLVVLDSRDLRAELARAEADLENARAHLTRMEELFAKDAVSKQDLDNAKRAFKVAEADKQAILAQLSYTVVKAPFDGVITEKIIEVGELASPGRPLLKMEDPKRLRLEATVAEGDLMAVAPGDKVPIVVDALGAQTLTGTISQILPAGDPRTHTFLVKVDLPPTPGLKTGMFGRVQLDKGAAETMVVPKSAVVERGELTGVFVIGPDHIARLRWVKVGRTVGGKLEILSGLRVGEWVLLEGSKGADGARVRVLDVTATP